MAKNTPAAKVKKGKGRGPEQPAQAQLTEARVQPAAAPAVVALHPSSHDVHAQSSIAHAGNHDDGWSEPAHDANDNDDDNDDAWGDGPAASADYWGAPSGVAEQSTANVDGAPSEHGWGSPASPTEEWDEPTQPATASEWGQPQSPAPTRDGVGAYGVRKGRGGVQVNPQPPTAVARAPAALGPTSFHPSSAAAHASHMSPSQGWGPHPTTTWGEPDPPNAWGQPAAHRPPPAPATKPAWTKWAQEVKMVNVPPASAATPYLRTSESAAAYDSDRQVLSEQQRSQILSSLLDIPGQQTKGYSSQSQPHSTHHHRQHPSQSQPQAFHPSQSQPQAFHLSQSPHQPFHPSQHPGYMNPRVVEEQHNILQSIQAQNARGSTVRSIHTHSQHGRNQPMEHGGSWERFRNEWGERASTIPEEDEEYEDDGWGDDGDEDDGWGQGGGTGNQRVRFSPNVDYASQSPASVPQAHLPTQPPTHAHIHAPTYVPAPASVTSSSRNGQRSSHVWMPSPRSSRTMRIASATLPTPTGTMKTTIFELAPPRNGIGENGFIDSYGEALRPAERALYSRDRPAKERFRWGFNPEKDQRVGSLLRWVGAMSNGLASIGLQRFLDSRERGALFANADFRIPSTSTEFAQPAFDWLTLTDIQGTLDSTLQSSVTLYDPAYQVVVFVFLLSPSRNSMAVWRRKLDVPDALRDAHEGEILEINAEIKGNYPVYVDELPVHPDETTSSVPKKKVRFAFIRGLFRRKKKVATAA